MIQRTDALAINELYQQLMWIYKALNSQVGTVEPPTEYKQAGFLAYADGSTWNPGSGEGLYYWDGSAWRLFEKRSNKGAASGYCPLNSSTKIDATYGGSASGIATLNSSTLAVEDPANAVVTAAASKIVKAGTAGKISTGWLSRFQSAQQTITSAGSLTLAHGLTDENGTAVVPWDVSIWLVCQTAEAGYSVGNWVLINPIMEVSLGNYGISLVADSTNLNIRYGSHANPMYLPHKTTGVGTTLNVVNWKAVFRAWA